MRLRRVLLLAALCALATTSRADWQTTTGQGGGGGGGVSSVTGTAPVSVANTTTTPLVSMHVADATHSGYLNLTDWAAFNGKQSTLSAASSSVNGYLASTDWATFNNKGAGTVTTVSGTAPVVSSGGTTPAISMHVADVADNGYLSSADWATFNGKQAAGSYALQATAINTTAPLAGGGNLSTTRTLSIPAGTSSANGYLASGDWSTFNGKAAAGANADITSLSQVAKLYPASNGTAALGIFKADGTTLVADFDTTNARVGIGTATPAYQMTVDGGSLDAGSGNGVLQIMSNPTNYGPELRLNNLSSGHAWLLVSGASADTVGLGNFAIQDGGNVRVAIDTSGNVGIGSTPASKLDVNGGVRLSTATVRPSCASGIRGTLWAVASAGGATDTLSVCLKSAADTYSWVQIVTGG